MSDSNKRTFKILLVGDGGVGKTTYIKKLKTSEFEKKYVATVGVEVHPLTIYTNEGKYCLHIWDTAGQEKFGGLRDGYYIGADACMYMCDLTSAPSVCSILQWFNQVGRVTGDIPSIIIGNKKDLIGTNIKLDKVSKESDMLYCDVSVKKDSNLKNPLLILLKLLTGNENLQLVDPSIIQSPNKEYEYREKVATVLETNPIISKFLENFDENDEKVILGYLSLKHIN